jgi:hypothetical protein
MYRAGIVNVNMINVYRSSARFRILQGKARSRAFLPGRMNRCLSFFGFFCLESARSKSSAERPVHRRHLLYSCFPKPVMI